MKKTKILLRGYYNYYNFGDDLLLISILYFFENNLKNYNRELRIFLRHDTQKRAFEKLGYKSELELKVGNSIEKPIHNLNKRLRKLKIHHSLIYLLDILLLLIIIFNVFFFKIFKQYLFFKKEIDFYRKLDIIHYLGGGYFYQHWRRRIIFEIILMNIAKSLNPNLKIIGTGMGIGPLHNKLLTSSLRRFLNNFDYLYLRNKISLNFVKKLSLKTKAVLSYDDTLLILPLLKKICLKKGRSDLIGINLITSELFDSKQLRNSARNFLKFVIGKNFAVEYFSTGKIPDESWQELVKNYTDVIHNPYQEGLLSFIKSLSRVEIGFGASFHFNFLLSLMSIPTIEVYCDDYYKQKIKGYMKVLDIPFALDVRNLNDKKLKEVIEIISSKRASAADGKLIESLYQNMAREYTNAYSDLISVKNPVPKRLKI